jgi:hypothetical protein
MVTPLFYPFKTPDIFSRDVATAEERLFLPGEDRFCTNCHTFPGNPELQEKDLRLAVQGRIVLGEERGYGSVGTYKFSTREGLQKDVKAYFMNWDHRGERLVVTAGSSIYSRPLITLETQVFYVLGADLRIFDARNGENWLLPGASTRENAEAFPTWSADGKTIMFCRAAELPGWRERTLRPRLQFDLYRVPYNDGKGGEATPVPGAHDNGRSNFTPRYSPDGKWVVFNKASFGALVKPDSDLWILSTEQGATPRELECNDHRAMDSHHCWSSNSRWLLFATKRDDGIFARAYLAEIDENGHASPAVELPRLTDPMMCCNVPEFMRYTGPIDRRDMRIKTMYPPERY